MARRVTLLFIWLWDRLVLPDPGLLRLQFALRVLFSVSITLFTLIIVDAYLTIPFGAYGLGFLVAQFTAVAVRDPDPWQQKLTILLTPLPAMAAITVATVLAPYPAVVDTGFLLVVFLAIYARRFGQRYTAFGMVGFIAYYIGQFLHPKLSMLPYGVLAVTIATGADLLVRFVLLKPRPGPTLRRVIAHIRNRIARMLGDTARVLGAEQTDPAALESLRHQLARLKEAVLVAEDQIAALNPAADQAAAGSQLGLRVFDLELAAERLVQLAFALPPSPQRPVLARIARLQRDLLAQQPGQSRLLTRLRTRFLIRPLPPRQPSVQPPDPRIAAALDRLTSALARMPPDYQAPTLARIAAPAASVQPESSSAPKGWLDPNLRAAIQVAVATAIAIALGEMVSPQRWYWGVIAAFVIFSGGTGPRSVTVTKALQRMVGTIIGVAVGMLVAGFVAGHLVIGIALVLACDFLAFHAFQAAYGLMIFWITIMLSLLYGFLGLFSPNLLVLRLEETGIGVAAGIVIALLLLPTDTRTALRQAARDFLATLAAALDAIMRQLREGNDAVRPLAEARALDRSLQAMRAVAGPLARGWAFATPRDILRVIRAAWSCTYALRELAEIARLPPVLSEAEAASIDSIAAVAAEEIASVRHALEAGHGPIPLPARGAVRVASPSEAVRAMERVRAAVHMLARAAAGTFRD